MLLVSRSIRSIVLRSLFTNTYLYLIGTNWSTSAYIKVVRSNLKGENDSLDEILCDDDDGFIKESL